MLELFSNTALDPSKLDLAIKISSIAENIFTIIALITGGIWTYKIFRQKRHKYPRANINHSSTCWLITDNRMLIRVSIMIENIGDVIMKPCEGEIWIQVIRPWPISISEAAVQKKSFIKPGKLEAEWPQLRERKWKNRTQEIEPGETDAIHFDFTVSHQLETIQIYSHVLNPIKQPWIRWGGRRNIGWSTTTIHNLDPASNPCRNNTTVPTTAAARAKTTKATSRTTSLTKPAATRSLGLGVLILLLAKALLKRSPEETR